MEAQKPRYRFGTDSMSVQTRQRHADLLADDNLNDTSERVERMQH
jgi:hypothetical protein